ncbi:hypothetical protein EWM64_g8439 [Hericium alpestre]|uniref:Uncharacterized protein n=1 Tax=Hericium alpestre TaxID=135208 RepID=A0A4Y9ZNK9_9AGAM|nr:hypothetical protein EWM64_g8439 [Hericium alpestre]
MPLAPVNEEGGHLYYEDSGPVEGTRYTTLVIIHGTAIHGAIFRPMMAFAAPNRLRIVVVNRRNYPGSTPHTEDELVAIAKGSSLESQSAFIARQGLEIAEFLSWFIETQDIPQAHEDEEGTVHGGLALAGWSSANTLVFALLSHLTQVPDKTRATIEPYLRTCFHYDGPRWTSGLPHIEPFTRSLSDASTQEERWALFELWVSAYHQHPNLASRSTQGLALRWLDNPPPDKIPTFRRMTREEVESVSSPSVLWNYEVLLRGTAPSVHADHMRKALFDKENADIWPVVKVKYVQCSESPWEMLSVMWETEKLYEDTCGENGGPPGRTIEFHLMEDANHCGNYLTVVLVHGTAIHGAIFHCLLPFAAANGLRLVMVNRLDYPGSTRLTDEDLAALASPDNETRAEYIRQRALEFGEFLAWYVQQEKIPPYTVADDGKEEGGYRAARLVVRDYVFAEPSRMARACPGEDATRAGAVFPRLLRIWCVSSNVLVSFWNDGEQFQIRPVGRMAFRIHQGSTIP